MLFSSPRQEQERSRLPYRRSGVTTTSSSSSLGNNSNNSTARPAGGGIIITGSSSSPSDGGGYHHHHTTPLSPGAEAVATTLPIMSSSSSSSSAITTTTDPSLAARARHHRPATVSSSSSHPVSPRPSKNLKTTTTTRPALWSWGPWSSPAGASRTSRPASSPAPTTTPALRKSRLRRPAPAAAGPSSSTRTVRLLVFVLAILLTSCLLASVYLLQQLEEPLAASAGRPSGPFWQRPPSSSSSSLRRNQVPPAVAAAAPQQLPPVVSNREIIDMRQLTYTLPFDNPDGGVWKQGWEVIPRPVDAQHPLTILVIPHSHCDPGWIKTFDEYFMQQTSSIISTIIQALQQDARRTFIWAEISYFSWWYEQQDEALRQVVHNLLQRKQLEFVTGGWVQPDEANSQLYAMEIQLQEGHDWIRRNVGAQYVPQYGWSIDPFGYSPTAAYLWKKYNMTGMLIQRVHYAVKKYLAQRQQLEFTWRQTWDDAAGQYDIFTHLMPFFSYDIPHTCGPDPSICCQFDFKRSPVGAGPSCPWNKPPVRVSSHNVAERARLLLDQYQKKAALYRGNVVLIPLGDDFRWQTAQEATDQYTNYQAMFDYINEHVPGVTIKFGTLSEYFTQVQGQFQPPLLKGSFFTYADVNEDYWSGYFTSRVFDKALDRHLERVIFAAESLGATALQLQGPRRALSLFQHHDGVTGTAKNHVVEDYAQRMYTAIQFTQQWLLNATTQQQQHGHFAASIGAGGPGELQPCFQADEPRGLAQNRCLGYGRSEAAVVLYNPLPTEQACGTVVIPGHQFGTATLPCEQAGPVLSANTKIVFDLKTGLMVEPIREEWKVWKVNHGGAYLFFPGQMINFDTTQAVVESGGYIVATEHWKRTVVERQVPNGLGSTTVVLDFIFETFLTNDNEEWLVRFSGDINNQGIFHTDLNGFNFDTHRFRKDLPIQSQVFPMPTHASIEDDHLRMTVLSEHAQGTASLQDGAIDVWLDRRLRQDDARGLGQGVQDNRPTRTRLRVVLERDGFQQLRKPGTVDQPSLEFDITPVTRRMWDELQHPLEMFGRHVVNHAASEQHLADPQAWAQAAKQRGLNREQRRRIMLEEKRKQWLEHVEARKADHPTEAAHQSSIPNAAYDAIHQLMTTDLRKLLGFRKQGGRVRTLDWNNRKEGTIRPPLELRQYSIDETIVPFVYMVYNRVDYLKDAIESLRRSDFPRGRVPLIISHDGHVPEMVDYVEQLKHEFRVVQLFHPHSCYEHPDTFPGDDPKLNQGYKGDKYGNPRSAWATCAKHHFLWILKTVFALKDIGGKIASKIDHFFFLEEDYVVAPTIYSAVVAGLDVMDAYEKEADGGFFGIGFDPTEASQRSEPIWMDGDTWFADVFHTGPMTMSRSVYAKLQRVRETYCKFDDYNWDWSLTHVQGHGLLPHTILFPSRAQVKHIGVSQGMHADHFEASDLQKLYAKFPDHMKGLSTKFQGTRFYGEVAVEKEVHDRGYGGWGHPADQAHCNELLRPW